MSQLKLTRTLKDALPKQKISLSQEQLNALKNIGEVILGLAATGGLLTVAVIAPNALKLINTAKWARKTYKNWGSKTQEQKNKIASSFYYLKSRGYVDLEPKNGNFLVKITQKGRGKIIKMNFESLRFKKEKSWDKKIWLIFADIPVELRSQANVFRKKIKNMGLFTLQRSIWAYPYDIRDEVNFISKYYGLDQYVSIAKTSWLEQEDSQKISEYYKNQKII